MTIPNEDEQAYGGYPIPATRVNLNINLTELPTCPACQNGVLLPLQDETRQGNVLLKGWVCSNPKCYHNFMLKAGDLISQASPGKL